MSADERNTPFERWALLGAMALAVVGFAAFYTRHDAAAPEPDDAAHRAPPAPSDILRVRIGGERPESGAAQPQPPRTGPNGPEGPSQVTPDPPPKPPPREPRVVVVQPGETLGQIVQRELGTVTRLDEVVRLNEIEDPDDIREGMELRLPVD